ncbi:MAG: NAD(P)/FAD-dependent oxidoreductase [Acidimicrobiales bacterium]
MERVVVVGAGFAGLSAAHHLARHPVQVTLVDRHNFHTFQPLLYQVATAGLDPADVAYPVRTIFGRDPNVTFRHGRVESVDLAARRLALGDGTTLDYDQLVVATGATTGFFGVPGAAAHGLPLYTLADARHVRDQVLGCLEAADARPERFDGAAPTFVVVGGGATGVETSGALMELLEVSVRRDRLRIDPQRTRVVLLEAGERLLSGFEPEASHYALDTLVARGVDVRLRTAVGEVTADGVQLADGTHITAAVVIWAGGVTVDGTLAASLSAPTTRGSRVVVRPDLSLEGHPEVFVAGDAAAVPWGPKRTEACPQVAQVAIQSGRHIAAQIVRRQAGSPTTAFAYHDKGLMATIGRHAAVAQLRHGLILRGTLGWLAWLGLHLVYLVGFRNRVVVLVNWCWRYLDWPSGPRLIMADVEADT